MTGIEIAALASAAISAGSGAANTISAGKMNKRGEKFAREENANQRQFQIDMWNRQNAYNDPQQQMERLKAAGINPHFYMSGGQSGPTSAPVPSSGGGAQPNFKAADFTPIAQSGQTMLQAEMMKAQIDNIKADTAKKSEETTGVTLSNGITTQILQNTPTSINLDNQIKASGIAKTTEETNLISAKIASEKQELINKIDTNEQIRSQIDAIVAGKAYTEQQTTNLVASLALTQSQIKTEGLKQANIASDTALKKAEANYKSEVAKTQPFVRSNLAAGTAKANAETKNLGKMYQNLEEDRKSKERTNFLGEKFDMNDRQNTYNADVNKIEVIKQTYRNLMKDEQFKDLKIDEQEFINMNMGIDTGLRPIKEAVGFGTGQTVLQNQTRNSRSMQRNSRMDRTTVHRYDSQGNYSGHTSTRRHRR